MNARRVFIIAKTYPELSSKYGETVCTAGIDEDGNPLRLYPIPFRYLSGPQRFRRYQWISASLSKSQRDLRPESYNLDSQSIQLGEEVPVTPDEWGKRADIILKSDSWQYSSMKALLENQRAEGRSLAFVRPREITGVSVRKRSSEDAESFEQKLKSLRSSNAAARKQLDLFESTVPRLMKNLQYVGERVCIDWLCSDADCPGHSMQVLDWEICELARRHGLDAAKAKVESMFNSDRYRTALILGNFHMFPGSFAIIGLWYPLRNERLF
jgi:hypothetical protein